MKKLKDDGNYWILELKDYIMMMHRMIRDDVGSMDFCVGELLPNKDGTWEVWVSKSYRSGKDHGQQLILATCGSQDEAVELLWDQRNLMNWGYYQ